VHPDILPLAIWFDSVDELANGLGYVSEDAYDNPLGELKFHGARIDRATRADWEAWRKKAEDAYVQRGALPRASSEIPTAASANRIIGMLKAAAPAMPPLNGCHTGGGVLRDTRRCPSFIRSDRARG